MKNKWKVRSLLSSAPTPYQRVRQGNKFGRGRMREWTRAVCWLNAVIANPDRAMTFNNDLRHQVEGQGPPRNEGEVQNMWCSSRSWIYGGGLTQKHNPVLSVSQPPPVNSNCLFIDWEIAAWDKDFHLNIKMFLFQHSWSLLHILPVDDGLWRMDRLWAQDSII